MSFQKLINLSPSTKSLNRLNLFPFNRNLCSATVTSSNKSKITEENTFIGQNELDQKRSDKSDNKLYSADGNWHISCGLVIQRFPSVVPEFNVIEKSFHEYNLKLEYEKSLLSDYDYAIEKVR